LVASEFHTGRKPAADDGRILHESTASDFVLHAHLVGSQLEIHPDHSGDVDVDFFDFNADTGRGIAAAPCV
jgi:hypothetical protein